MFLFTYFYPNQSDLDSVEIDDVIVESNEEPYPIEELMAHHLEYAFMYLLDSIKNVLLYFGIESQNSSE